MVARLLTGDSEEARRLYGYRFSVYTRIVRLVLELKGLDAVWIDTNPFDPEAPPGPHPFGRVPVLEDNGHRVFETGAITRYLDRAYPDPPLMPETPRTMAQVDQVIALVDAYLYWPLVRQVFAQRVFRPLVAQPVDEAEVAAGLAAAPRVLAVLDAFANAGDVLNLQNCTLADCHLAPMIDYFQRAPDGAAMLADYSALSAWWDWVRDLPEFRKTDPELSPEAVRSHG